METNSEQPKKDQFPESRRGSFSRGKKRYQGNYKSNQNYYNNQKYNSQNYNYHQQGAGIYQYN